MRRPFRRLSVVASHDEFARGDQDHRRTVAVADDFQRPARVMDAGLGPPAESTRQGARRLSRDVLRDARRDGPTRLGRVGGQFQLDVRRGRSRADRSGGLDDHRLRLVGLRRRRGFRGVDRHGLAGREQRQVQIRTLECLLGVLRGLRFGVRGDDPLEHRDGQWRVPVQRDLTRLVVHIPGLLFHAAPCRRPGRNPSPRSPVTRDRRDSGRVPKGRTSGRSGIRRAGGIPGPDSRSRSWPSSASHRCRGRGSPPSSPCRNGPSRIPARPGSSSPAAFRLRVFGFSRVESFGLDVSSAGFSTSGGWSRGRGAWGE